jgi:hypothetical protein
MGDLRSERRLISSEQRSRFETLDGGNLRRTRTVLFAERMKLLAIAAVLVLAACGSGNQSRGATSSTPSASPQQASPSAQPSPSPRPLSTSLFVIATGLQGAQPVNPHAAPGQATVQIVDATSHVYASATFRPPPAPLIGNAAPLMQSPVRTARGAVFYADSAGAVHKLKPDGSNSVVATFPLTNGQQELTYAVSPDGVHLIAIIVSTPPIHNPPPQTLGDPLYVSGGHWTLQVQTADAGGATSTTLQRDLGTNYPSPTTIVGWDARGPLATLNTHLGAQQELPSDHLYGSPLIHIGPDGTHLDSLGGPGCVAVDEIPDGTVVCDSDGQTFSVRTSSGAILWQSAFSANDYYPGLWLSPDANAVAAQGVVVTRYSVASASRQNAAGSSLVALGWLDSNTVVVATQLGELSLYDAATFIKIRDMGLLGIFEGVL